MSKLVFVSKNPYKYEELAPLFLEQKLDVEYKELGIDEIQSHDILKIIENKTLQAYKAVGHPVFVEHTGLYISAWNGMPGGLTQLFWDNLQGAKICKMLSQFDDRTAIAKTVIGFCDGKKLLSADFHGELEGEISPAPRGERKFQWGTIFIPSGGTKTYSELSLDEVNKISHRAAAFKKFVRYSVNHPIT